MTQSFLPFSKPTISQTEVDEVVACLESNWLTTGPRVTLFEEKLSDCFGRSAHALSSATAGLHLALLSLGVGKGDEVITTPLTFVATLNVIVHLGATPVLVDICPKTYNLSVEGVKAAISSRTKAIMPVHFAGLPVDCDALYELARENNLRIVEDCAHAIGASYKHKKIGSFGDVQVFSFHPNKNMTTGEGGCLVTTDQVLVEKVKSLRFHGINKDVSNRFAKEGSQFYDVAMPGYKYNMMDMQAALGIHQIDKLDEFIAKRNSLAERYYGLLAELDALILPSKPAYVHTHAWHLFAPLVDETVTTVPRNELIAQLKTEGVGVGLHYQAAHLFSYYQNEFGFKEGAFPNAEKVAATILSLPLFPDMTEAEQDNVVQALFKVLKG